jgi:hypothetical protein
MTHLPAFLMWYPSGAMRSSWPPPVDWVFSREKGQLGWWPAKFGIRFSRL